MIVAYAFDFILDEIAAGAEGAKIFWKIEIKDDDFFRKYFKNHEVKGDIYVKVGQVLSLLPQ